MRRALPQAGSRPKPVLTPRIKDLTPVLGPELRRHDKICCTARRRTMQQARVRPRKTMARVAVFSPRKHRIRAVRREEGRPAILCVRPRRPNTGTRRGARRGSVFTAKEQPRRHRLPERENYDSSSNHPEHERVPAHTRLSLRK